MSRSPHHFNLIERRFRACENTEYIHDYIKKHASTIVSRVVARRPEYMNNAEDSFVQDSNCGSKQKTTALATKKLEEINKNISHHIIEFCMSGTAYDILKSDTTTTSRYTPTLMTGASRHIPTDTISFWDEISRLNTAFVRYVETILDDTLVAAENAPRESYEMQMFMADSLYPAGWEHLNGEGPLHEHREYRSTMDYGNIPERRGIAGSGTEIMYGANCVGVSREDRENFDNIRDILLGNGKAVGPASTEQRIMRYETIPFWQKTSDILSNVDREREFEIGSTIREADSQIRRWKKYQARNRPISKVFMDDYKKCRNGREVPVKYPWTYEDGCVE